MKFVNVTRSRKRDVRALITNTDSKHKSCSLVSYITLPELISLEINFVDRIETETEHERIKKERKKTTEKLSAEHKQSICNIFKLLLK